MDLPNNYFPLMCQHHVSRTRTFEGPWTENSHDLLPSTTRYSFPPTHPPLSVLLPVPVRASTPTGHRDTTACRRFLNGTRQCVQLGCETLDHSSCPISSYALLVPALQGRRKFFLAPHLITF